ncbi:hypothetical protein ASG29_09380 [Sphingomonas sp. Leaf412]|uniref:copper chaperone PCu(A)C n=1 Tax=Sphingomonas sp. Leaf412 TaxID=1736370 RepID=UPI0006F277F9|nr:copper chaperone PCu(A)C [Sphingomonas sp. Leaf412]KQT32053.1 hypothetical protein ASG29_09380 [Sphingomonas sp. Leaf412]
MRAGFAMVMAIASTGACSKAAAPAASDAWVRLAAVPGRPAAAYFTLHGGAGAATLAQVSAPGVARIELHESRMTGNGMMAMNALADVPVPAGATVKFAPAGNHAMLFGVPADVKPGGTLVLTFRFSDGTAVQAPAKVFGAGEAGL